MKILFTGGGTGGHIYPIIAIVREIKKLQLEGGAERFEFFYIGPEDDFSSSLLSQEGIRAKTISAGKLRRYWNWQSVLANLVDLLFKIPLGIAQAFVYIFFLAPDLIFSKGGYGSLPAVIAGWIFQTPIFLHESDIIPGFSNKILNKFALEIFVSFPVFVSFAETEYFPRNKMIITGNPIRTEVLEGSREGAEGIFGLSGEKPIILILGGSQGAQRINDMVLAGLPKFLEKFELIHQCGLKNFEEVRSESRVVIKKELERYYHLVALLKEADLKHAYRACDWIISRAGSGSIFEIAALGKPSILIPLAGSAQEHQAQNAYAYAKTDAALVMEEPNLDPLFLLERIIDISNSPQKIKQMSKKAKEFAKPRAARIIAEYIIDYLKK